MALIDIDERGRRYRVEELPHEDEFNHVWLSLPENVRADIEEAINRRLDTLINYPDPNWGSITNISIEGGKLNSTTGLRGDWRGTVFQPIYDYFLDEVLAGMFYGNVWKKVIIERTETWIGIRQNDENPTFQNREITLPGKTYFLPGSDPARSGQADMRRPKLRIFVRAVVRYTGISIGKRGQAVGALSGAANLYHDLASGVRDDRPGLFKWRQTEPELILCAVRW